MVARIPWIPLVCAGMKSWHYVRVLVRSCPFPKSMMGWLSHITARFNTTQIQYFDCPGSHIYFDLYFRHPLDADSGFPPQSWCRDRSILRQHPLQCLGSKLFTEIWCFHIKKWIILWAVGQYPMVPAIPGHPCLRKNLERRTRPAQSLQSYLMKPTIHMWYVSTCQPGLQNAAELCASRDVDKYGKGWKGYVNRCPRQKDRVVRTCLSL